VTPSPAAGRVLRRAGWLGSLLVLAALAACDNVDNAAFDSAYRSMNAAEVTVRGTVSALLPDSPAGADGPHQRFDVAVDGVSVEIDHNLDLAQRVPVATGDVVVIHGQFEPDPGHPVIHYTHHATGSHEGGWIQLNGSTYE
jgi:Protein of unknown function (DUF3465)